MNKPHYFAQYDPYRGGTYRMGERTDNAALEAAPKKITAIANDYSIQIDADVSENKTMPVGGKFGVACWAHSASDGSGTVAGFNFMVSSTEATIGLWDDINGSYHKLGTGQVSGALAPQGAVNHLTAQCIQGNANGGPTAKLSLALNGKPVVAVQYAKSVRTYEWKVGDAFDLLVSGKGSDVFYDNVAMTSKCSGSFC